MDKSYNDQRVEKHPSGQQQNQGNQRNEEHFFTKKMTYDDDG